MNDKKRHIKRDVRGRQQSTRVEPVNKGWTNNSPKKNESLKEKIDERLKSIERSIIYTQNNSLAELIKKIEILNSPLDIDRKRDKTVLNTTKSSDNKKNNRHIGILFVININNMDILRTNVIDIIKLLNKLVN